MPRKVAWGTPGRSERFLKPRSGRSLVLTALGLAVGLVVVYVAMEVAGFRGPIAPGSLTSAHAPVEASCRECHAPRVGASSLRCQRCHDPSGAGRLTHSAHVLFGSGDAKQAAAAPEIACARCHVEHRGRSNKLAQIDQAQCLSCHFPSFASHPEFAALRAPAGDTPGLKFPHQRHVQEYVKRGTPAAESCVKCHEPQNRDFAPLEFDRHCAACHAPRGSVGIVEPLPVEDARPAGPVAEGFEVVGAQVSKAAVTHRDAWVSASLAQLRQDLDPAGQATERAALVARLGQLRQRLALASPLAALDIEGLRARERTLLGESPGHATRELLRVRDELELRRAGAAPPRTAVAAGQQRAIETQIRALEARLAELPESSPRKLTPEETARKLESAEILATSCLKCHFVEKGAFAPVAPAQRVLVRARFQHQPHLLQAECLRCHEGVPSSRDARDRSLQGITSCRECHRPGGAPQTCQACHQFHPRELP